MDYKEMFKKYWFVMLIAIGMLVFLVLYIVDLGKKKELVVNSKEIDGKYVIYSINGQNYYADDLYDTLYQDSGAQTSFEVLKKSVLEEGYETSEDMKSIAATYAEYVASSNDPEEVAAFLKQYGYNNGIMDLSNYYINSQKEIDLMSDFYFNNYDKYVKAHVDVAEPKLVYHILVKVADVQTSTDENGKTVYTMNPTAEETEKLNTVKEALKTESFEDVAIKYSEDGSAADGGYLSVIDNYIASNYVEEFSKAALALNPGEVSDVVESQYGYHIIKVEEADIDTLCDDPYFLDELNNYYQNAIVLAVKDKAKELGFTINDSSLNEYLNEAKIEIAESEVSE